MTKFRFISRTHDLILSLQMYLYRGLINYGRMSPGCAQFRYIDNVRTKNIFEVLWNSIRSETLN